MRVRDLAEVVFRPNRRNRAFPTCQLYVLNVCVDTGVDVDANGFHLK